MKSIVGVIILLPVLSMETIQVKAQFNVAKWQFGIGVGTLVYQGDLAPSAAGSYKTLRPAVNLSASRLLSNSFSWRANLLIGGLKGDESKYDHPEYRQQRNFSFTSPVAELSGLAEWNVLGRNYSSRGFAPYIFGGAGLSLLKVRRDYSRFNAGYFGTESELVTGLTADIQTTPPRLLLVLPVGIGARYYFSDRIGISAESSYRIMSNDYLDGFSQSANPAKGDHYYNHSIGVVYRIGKKNMLDCPVVRY